MGIFSEEEKNRIKQDALKLAGIKEDNKNNFNVTELLMALQIIRRVLGEEWYVRAGKEMNENIETPDFLKMKQSPIAHYLREGDPAKYIRLIGFAKFLKSLVGKTNVQSKIKEYTKESRKRKQPISVERFESTYFELKIASHLLHGGFRIEFIKEIKDRQTPDLRIGTKYGSTVAECKKKRSKNTYSISSILDSIQDANNQLVSSGFSGIVFVEVSANKPFSKDDFCDLQTKIEALIVDMSKVMAVIIFNEYAFLDTLTDEQVIRTDKHSIVNPKSEKHIQDDVIENIVKSNIPMQKSLYAD